MAISWIFKSPILFLLLLASAQIDLTQSEEPTFTQCRVHIEAAIKGISTEPSQFETPVSEEDNVVLNDEQPIPPIVEQAIDAQEATLEQESEEHFPVTSQDEQDEEEVEEENENIENAMDEDHNEEDDREMVEEEIPQEIQEEVASAQEAVSEPETVLQDEAVLVEEHAIEKLPEPDAEAIIEEAPIELPTEETVPEPTLEPVIESIPEPEPAVVIEEPIVVANQPDPVAVKQPDPVVVVETPVEILSEPPVESTPPVIVEDPAEGSIEEPPEVRRPRDHIAKILRLGQDAETDMMRDSLVLSVLKDVKKLVENSVRSLEGIFKYNDVSNRNFGDPEIFSKPLVLFLGPWSGGKSSIINYLLDTEFTQNALKTGAEPSATFFQILMYGESEEMLDGTQLAADWTFSGLQKFGQAFIDRLRGKRLPNKLLEKVNIVEVPGILEVRKQVDRPYPFNDVVQWFIDRADIIFVVYDPTKLDTGLEHEALFDQLKGRQNQVRVLLNKADSVTQEELLLIQNNLVWNLSPLMASPLPPTLYAGSFWSKPYKSDAPVRLLRSHEENMLNDLRDTIDNAVENTIAEARRHAVRVRNHAKMVDCYLTTFFNHKGYFGNKKATADDIIENPHTYHIFEGLSTLNNISRYDLPDAEVYKDFFRLHALYDFKPLASTCTFFRGCPLDKLDTAIAYELPELIGKYKKRLQSLKAKKTGH